MIKNKSNYIETISKGQTYINNNYIMDNRLTTTEKTLYTLIQASCFADKVHCYPSQITLATALNKSVRTIQRCLKKLKELEYLTIRRRGSIPNLITLLQKKIRHNVEKALNKAKKSYYNKKNSFNENCIAREEYSDPNVLSELELALTAWQRE